MAEEDLDLVMHLGDYIYENPGRNNFVRKHVGGELMTVDDYRNRYAQYRSDPALQATHAAFPFLVVWDDHEVDNNYAGLHQEAGAPVEQFALRRAAGYKAYYEHMPLRRSSIPAGALLQLYRPFTYGALANILMLDTRQYRTDQPCGDNVQLACDATRDPRASLLGAAQEQWLLQRLDRSRTGWNFLAQQIPIARLDRFPGAERRYSMDKWDGYEHSRSRLLRFLGTRKPANPVALAGDVHNNWVNDLRFDVADPKTPVVATEFVGTSITSAGDGSDMSPTMKAMVSENECVRFANDQRGYVQVRPQAEGAARRLPRRGIRVEAWRADQDQGVVCRGGWASRGEAGLGQLGDLRPANRSALTMRPTPPRAYRGRSAVRPADTNNRRFRDPLPFVQVSVDPGSCPIFDVLRNRMGGVPVSFRVFPHRAQGGRKRLRRCRLRQRLAEFFESHLLL